LNIDNNYKFFEKIPPRGGGGRGMLLACLALSLDGDEEGDLIKVVGG
jgi:hypothetical protein